MQTTPSATTDRLGAIAQARRALHQAGPAAAAALLPAWIAQSWQRCVGRGQQPDDRLGFDVVSRGGLRQAREQGRDLLKAATPVLAELDRAIAASRYFSLLTDARGVVLTVGATADGAVPAVHSIARPGVDLSEPSVGTTAIGAALGELQPVWLHRGEHYFDATAVYSCAGAPIVGPDGQLAGMLDLTGVLVDERPELRHLAAQMAHRIEAALLAALPRHRLLRVQWPGVPGSDPGGTLAVDADGVIVGADRGARAILGLRWGGPVVRFGPLDAWFAAPLGHLLGLRADAPAQLVPLWSGLRTLVGAADPAGDCAASGRWHDAQTRLVREAIDAAHGNVSRAAAGLGISRATLYRRLAAQRRR